MTQFNEIIVTTFVSPQLFWIIKRKYLLIRSKIDRFLAKSRKILHTEDIDSQLCVVNVDGIWARATVDQIVIYNGDDSERKQYVCWLIDYGVMIVTDRLFTLDESLNNLPPLAEKASLFNVVNITSDLIQDASMDFEIVESKTPNLVESVRHYTKNYLEKMDKLYFQMSLKKNSVQYGDILCLYNNQPLHSLTNFLIDEKVIAKDPVMFQEAESKRSEHHKEHFKHRQRWLISLEKLDKDFKKKVIFNSEDNKHFPMEYFDRKSTNNPIYDDF